ncbi:MAG: PilX N-terminal domain-containing pilus assembly protein [Aquabacterium sp.]
MPAGRMRQRGAAALTVVMVLFFIMALVAGYSSRNLIFEQKTSANTYRATQAMEAAEASIEWAITMLNGGRITATCTPSANNGDNTFRERYLTLMDDGHVDFRRWMKNGVEAPLVAGCVRGAAGLVCSCPTAADPTLVAPAQQPAPAYALAFENADAPGTVRILAAGCSFIGSDGRQCLGVPSGSVSDTDADAVSQIIGQVALVRALPAPPVAALTAGNRIQAAGVLEVSNVDPKTGITVRSATSVVAATPRYVLPAGTPGDGKVTDDAALLSLVAADRLFVSLFAMDRATFRRQPAAVRVDCPQSCGGDRLATAVANNPGRVIWVQGDIDLDQDGALGSAAQPTMVLVDGRATLSAQVVLTGLLHARNVDWNATPGSAVIGAVVAEGDFIATTDARVAYDAAVLDLIRRGHGSYVRVPGSWWDKK